MSIRTLSTIGLSPSTAPMRLNGDREKAASSCCRNLAMIGRSCNAGH